MTEKTAVVKIRHFQNVKKPKTERENICLEHFKYCCSVSSLHGLNQIVWPNRSPLERIFWICAVVGSTIFGITKSYDVFEHYYYRPAMISVELDYKSWRTEFPSPILCQLSIREDFLEKYNITEGSDMYEYLQDLAFSNYTSYHLYEKYANGSKQEYYKPEQYLEMLLEAIPTIQLDARDTSVKAVYPLGFERPIPTIITEIGICSVLNPSNGIYYTPEYFNSSEPYKYDPFLFVYNFDGILKGEMRGFSSHSKATMVSPNDVVDIVTKMYYFNKSSLSVFTASVITVHTPEAVQNLNIQQRNCRLFDEAEDLDHSPKYTPKLCQIECRIKLCLKYCNCTPYYYRRNPGEQICNMTGMYCLSKHVEELVNVADHTAPGSTCNCFQNCDMAMIFAEDISTATFIADTRLSVQILTHPDMRYVRRLIFSRLDLIIQIGGILGLCLGCTILGITELIYFMTLRFYWSVIRGRSIKSSL